MARAFLTAMVCVSLMVVSANAESAAVGFSGFVPKASAQGSVVMYPGTLVSFSDHAVLPIVGVTIEPTTALVFNEDGNLAAAKGAAYKSAGSGLAGAVLVKLNNSPVQAFKVCRRDGSTCVQYRVERY